MASVSDDFNRADNNDIGVNWTVQPGGEHSAKISSNAVVAQNASDSCETWTANEFRADQWAKVTVPVYPASSQAGVVLRASDSAQTFYWIYEDQTNGAHIQKVVAGAFTSLATNATNISAGQKVAGTVRGTLINIFADGVLVASATDAAIASGRIGFHVDGTATTAIDDFVGGDLPFGFVAAGTEGSAASGNITPGIPAGIQADDILIMVYHGSDQVAVTVDAAWTQIVQGNGGGTTSRLGVWWHRYDGVTAPSALITHASGQTPIAGIAAFRGYKRTGSPVNVAGSITGGTDASIEHGTITPTVDLCMLLVINGAADDNDRTLLSGFTNALEDTGAGTNNAFVSTAGTPDGSISMFYADWMAAATGTITVTQAASDPWASVLVALEPQVRAFTAPLNVNQSVKRASFH